MRIERMVLKNRYKIEWLRMVSGVDLSTHCMKSLKGTNVKGIRGYNFRYDNIEIPSGHPYYYFCAVDENWDWNKNIHIAWREKEGSDIIINDQFIDCHISGAERIIITKNFIDWNLPQSQNRLFHTCRNWQFANMIKNYLPKKPETPRQPRQQNLFDGER